MPNLQEITYAINLAYVGTYGSVVVSCIPSYLFPQGLEVPRNQLLGLATTDSQLQILLKEALTSTLFEQCASPKQVELLRKHIPHAKLPLLCQKGVKYLAHLDYAYKREGNLNPDVE